MKEQLKSYCKLYWWNIGYKTLSFKGELKELLKEQKITFTKRKTDLEGVFYFNFKNNNITFKTRGTIEDFPFYAKQFIQMELVRMGDKSELQVNCNWRPRVTVNF